MREVICGLMIGLAVGIPIGAWLHARLSDIGDDPWDEGGRHEQD